MRWRILLAEILLKTNKNPMFFSVKVFRILIKKILGCKFSRGVH